MAKFTDIFIRRPVLAIVVSLLIFIMGLRAISDLQVSEYPEMKNTVITVTTSYPGASADLIEGFITTPLEKSIASAGGLDYMTSESRDNISTIKFFVTLNYDPDAAFTEVMSKVSQVQNQLPKDADQPVIEKDTGSTTSLMYIGFSSDHMSAEQITDYISRIVQPALETVPGVADANILGAKLLRCVFGWIQKKWRHLKYRPLILYKHYKAIIFNLQRVKRKVSMLPLQLMLIPMCKIFKVLKILL